MTAACSWPAAAWNRRTCFPGGSTRQLPLADRAVSLRAMVADDVGQVVAVDLRRTAAIPSLRTITKVRGQIESLSCPDRGDWVLVGAAAVDASCGWKSAMDGRPGQ